MDLASSRRDLEHALIVLLQQVGPLSRAELARRAGLARSTVTNVIGGMIARKLVVEGEHERVGGRGRPPVLVSLVPNSGAAIGLDLGFSHVRGVLVDLSYKVLTTAEREIGIDYDVADGIEAAADIVRTMREAADVPPTRLLGVGVGVPCPTDLSGTVTRSAIIPRWSGTNIPTVLRPRLGARIVVENESRLAARGEHVWGAAKGARNFIYIKLHSGVGGAVAIDGSFVMGQTGGAGEFGHISLDPTGPLCRCGNRGCLETYAGIPAILSQVATAYPGLTLSGLLSLYETRDAAACRIMSEAARRVGQAAGMLCNALNPELVLVGGSLAAAGDRFLDEVRVMIPASSLELNRRVRVAFGQLGHNASALGAAARAFQVFADPSPLDAGVPVPASNA